MKKDEKYNQPIIIYDGECLLCSNAIRWILRHEKEPILKFATLANHPFKAHFSQGKKETIYFLYEGQIFDQSRAVFKVTQFLKQPWSWLAVFAFLPKSITDFFYQLIANNRYRLFGKVDDSCLLPQSLGERYLD